MAIEKTVASPIEPEIKTTRRKIHYYELDFQFKEGIDVSKANNQPFNAFFTAIAKMARDKEDIRYQEIGDAKVFVQDVSFDQKESFITGKLLYVKMDVFPELINIYTDEVTDITDDIGDNDGIVETTHFLIDWSKHKKTLILEYNHAGAKFADFILYCEKIGQEKGYINEITQKHYSLIVRDEIDTYESRIKAISSFSMKIHKNNISQIERIDTGLHSAVEAVADQYSVDYLELFLKFSVSKKKTNYENKNIRQSLRNLIKSLKEDRQRNDLFDTLKVTALDVDRNLKMTAFDLLADKVTSEISVQLKPKRKVVVSLDIFDKMKNEYLNKNL